MGWSQLSRTNDPGKSHSGACSLEQVQSRRIATLVGNRIVAGLSNENDSCHNLGYQAACYVICVLVNRLAGVSKF